MLGRIVGFRLEFGWWVFDGSDGLRSGRAGTTARGGGGLILDMYPHWRYVIETIIGRIVRVASAEWIATPERIDEQGARYAVDGRGHRPPPWSSSRAARSAPS